MTKAKQEETARKTHKKSKKHSKSSKESANEDDFKKLRSLKRKQTEVARVLQIKCALLLQGNLSYLEYMELRDELCRLNALKETFAKQATGFEKR
ncbi:PREDICTED: uncharacterized protein LOC108373228 [Rhagoletis zephyria]|uniref:uncharacterized protein LOC108373228 n=1 Tax=Rhagoletis zephyria TaxID=28612 RepID=UPI0008118CE7|nr:PREDICTED: uncharacterized protein LOC108373228 [Rhagoletis zephyria]